VTPTDLPAEPDRPATPAAREDVAAAAAEVVPPAADERPSAPPSAVASAPGEETAPLDPEPRTPWRESAGLAAFLGWLVPGLGHLWLRRPGKALHYFLVVGGAWALGMALADGAAISFSRHPVWLAAQAWLAGPTVAAAWLLADGPSARVPLFEVGQLYVAVASLLNVVAVADAVGLAETLVARRLLRAGAGGFDREERPPLVLPPALAGARPRNAVEDEWPPPPVPPPEVATP
jgi:hypothetical protein